MTYDARNNSIALLEIYDPDLLYNHHIQTESQRVTFHEAIPKIMLISGPPEFCDTTEFGVFSGIHYFLWNPSITAEFSRNLSKFMYLLINL